MRKQALLLLALAPALYAAAPNEFGGSVNGYSGSGGVRVITPAMQAGWDLDYRTRLALKADLDAVSAASFNYAQSKTHRGARPVGTCWTCHASTDALSGATRNYLEVRRGAEVSVTRLQGPLDLSATYLGNRENDYASDGAGLGLGWTSEDANTRVDLGASALFDRIAPVIRSGEEQLTTFGGDLTLTSLYSARGQWQAAWSMASADGFQSNPYSFVQIGLDDQNPLSVAQPRQKLRHTGRLSLRQGLWARAALEGGLRYYQDSWDVRSMTYELSLAQRFGALVLEPLVRFQDQAQGAYFFKNRYAAVETYRTRDLKLAPHQSLAYGVGLRGDLGAWAVETRWTRYQRRDALDYGLYFADAPENADLLQISVILQ